eukprot:5486706-Pyramimonas_sp.AAC.1
MAKDRVEKELTRDREKLATQLKELQAKHEQVVTNFKKAANERDESQQLIDAASQQLQVGRDTDIYGIREKRTGELIFLGGLIRWLDKVA